MNKPQLVAETPRAGKWNHRFIAAQNGSLSDSEVAKMIAAARRNPQGDDYLAVSADTAQSVSGRTGKEILVLMGVDVKKLSDSQRQQIIAQLDQRLADLATLVTEEIDWDKNGQAILIKRPELGEWEKGFGDLPTLTPRRYEKAAVPKKQSSGRLKMGLPTHNSHDKKVGIQSPPPPDNHFGAWWIVSILGFIMLMAVVCFFLPACNLFFTKTESTLTRENPHRKLADFLCEQFTWCDNAERNVEQALRDFETDSENINSVINDLNMTNDVWSFLLSFVDNSQGNVEAYLGKLAKFEQSNFTQIVAEQRKLRQTFESFQDVTQVSFDTAPDSAEYPVLSFVYKVKMAFPEMPEKTTRQEENRLPFFRNNDVERAKFLKGVIEDGRYNKLIKGGRHVKVFDALCQLSDEESLEANFDKENRIKEVCIVPDKNYPRQRQCERLKTEDQKKQAKAFLDLRDKLKTPLGCDT